MLITVFLISLILFTQQYAVNIIKYHALVPNCSHILSSKACSQYGPWIRDNVLEANKSLIHTSIIKEIVVFSGDWFYGMWLRMFFSLGGPEVDYQTIGPLIIPSMSAIAFSVIGLVATIISWKSWRRSKYFSARAFIVFATLVYVLLLYLDEFKSFKATGAAVAINGRYLFIILLPIIALFVFAVNNLFIKYVKLRMFLASLVILCLIWGGGVFTFILRSQNTWYWHSNFIINTNKSFKDILGPITPGYYTPTEFL